MKPLLLRAFSDEEIERAPVWLMRQAGRYMKEYRDLKERYSFLELCRSPDLATEVTMQPIKAFDPDAAILFSDILIPFQCMGIEIDFNPGPLVKNPVRSPEDVAALETGDPRSEVKFVFQALEQIRGELESAEFGGGNKALLGFAGAPWTMACYLLDQTPYKHFHGTQVFAKKHPEAMHQLLAKLTGVVSEYLLAQVDSGAQAVQLFDTWAGNLTEEDYRTFALPYTKQIFEKLHASSCPTVLYVNNCSHLLSAMTDSGASGFSIDARISLSEAEQIVGENSLLQGNLEPTYLFSPRAEVERQTKEMLGSLKRRGKYIANLGHGVLQKTPPENVDTFIKTVQAGWPTT